MASDDVAETGSVINDTPLLEEKATPKVMVVWSST